MFINKAKVPSSTYRRYRYDKSNLFSHVLFHYRLGVDIFLLFTQFDHVSQILRFLYLTVNMIRFRKLDHFSIHVVWQACLLYSLLCEIQSMLASINIQVLSTYRTSVFVGKFARRAHTNFLSNENLV